MCEKHTKHIKSLTDENTRKREDKVMSGHSKFANIKHKKEKNDAAKGCLLYTSDAADE